MPFFDSPDARLYYRAWEVDEPVAGFVFLHGEASTPVSSAAWPRG
jgi:hypothetical protein